MKFYGTIVNVCFVQLLNWLLNVFLEVALIFFAMLWVIIILRDKSYYYVAKN